MPRATKTICAIGDSLTFNEQYAVLMDEFYPEQLAKQLRALGCTVEARNFGWAGDNSTGVLRRIRALSRYEVPDIAIIAIGVNDPGDGRTATTLTRVGTTATFTASSAHSLQTGDVVTISGSNLSQFNVANAVVTVTTTTAFTYTIPSDPGANSAGTPRFDHQTQENIEAIILALRNNAGGIYGTQISGTGGPLSTGSQTLLPAGLPNGTRCIVRNDTSTTGGVQTGTAATGYTPPTPATLTGTQASTRLWISRNGLAGENGWSRIAPDNSGVSRIIMMSTQWVHRADGLGDTLAVPYATYVPVRTKQQAAAAAQSVTYFDLYTYQRNLIVNGYEGELTGTWAATANDQHPSPYAGYTWAKGLVGHIQSQEGWLTALTDSTS